MSQALLTEAEVFAALGLLFAANRQNCREMLTSIGEADIKKAYRLKAFQTHPDRFAGMGEASQKIYSERFIRINNAYEILVAYLKSLEGNVDTGPGEAGRGFSAGSAEFRSRRQGTAAGHGRGFDTRESAGQRYSRAYHSGYDGTGNWWPGYGRRRDGTGPFRFSGAGREADDFYFNGSFWQLDLPKRNLRFGEFLYYSGVIPWRLWGRALAWQNAQRPRIGEIAQRWRWATEFQIAALLSSKLSGERLGELMLENDLISPFQLRVLLTHQKKLQKPIGEYFCQKNLLTRSQIQLLLLRQRDHNYRHSSSARF